MPPLIFVQNDAEYSLVRRRGRFSVPVAVAASFSHLQAAVGEMQERMIAGLKLKGYHFVGPDFELQGPLPHIQYADSAEADPGPRGRPDPQDLASMMKFEEAEKARAAKKLEKQNVPEVDYLLIATFKRKLPPTARIVGGSGDVRSIYNGVKSTNGKRN